MIELKYILLNKYSNKIEAHYHNYYEITYYFSGEGYLTYGKTDSSNITGSVMHNYILVNSDDLNNRLNYSPFSCVLIPPHIVHFKQHTQDPKFLSLIFDIKNENFDFKEPISVSLSSKVQPLFNYILDEYEAKKDGYIKAIESIIESICIYLKRKNFEPTNDIDLFVKQTMNLFDDHFLSNIDLNKHCKVNNFSLDYFRHKFKEKTGMSPKHYILNKRLNYACFLLESSTHSIIEISEICKFTNYNQFSASFKKELGISPQKFRINKRNGIIVDKEIENKLY